MLIPVLVGVFVFLGLFVYFKVRYQDETLYPIIGASIMFGTWGFIGAAFVGEVVNFARIIFKF